MRITLNDCKMRSSIIIVRFVLCLANGEKIGSEPYLERFHTIHRCCLHLVSRHSMKPAGGN